MVVSPRGGSLPTTLAPPGGRGRTCSKRPFLESCQCKDWGWCLGTLVEGKVGGRGCCLAPADRATDHTPVSPTMMSWPPAAKKDIYGDVIICAWMHVYTCVANWRVLRKSVSQLACCPFYWDFLARSRHLTTLPRAALLWTSCTAQ